MGYLVEGLELFIRKVGYKKYDTTVLVRWSNYSTPRMFMSADNEHPPPSNWVRPKAISIHLPSLEPPSLRPGLILILDFQVVVFREITPSNLYAFLVQSIGILRLH
jgi:hypothetical protein